MCDKMRGLSEADIAEINGLFETGEVQNVAVWNIALSDEEIAEFASGIPPVDVASEQLVSYVPLVDDTEA